MGTVIKTSVDLPSNIEIKYSRFDKDENFKEGDLVYILGSRKSCCY